MWNRSMEKEQQIVGERPCYFPGQMISDVELTLNTDYTLNKLRQHNRLLHGWGVVCGAVVCPIPEMPWQIKITPGYILGPYGDTISISDAHTVDIRGSGSGGVTDDPLSHDDPWCSDVLKEPENGCLYVAVKYHSFKVRPVRVQPPGCGCDENRCEYSRIRDGYEIGFLPKCPESHQNPPDFDEQVGRGQISACPPVADDPWVVLAKVFVDDQGTIADVDNLSCRRMVLSFGHLWWRPVDEAGIISPDEPAVIRDDAEIRDALETLVVTEAVSAIDEDFVSVLTLEAAVIRGLNRQSALGQLIANESLTVNDIAVQSKDDFIAQINILSEKAELPEEQHKEAIDKASAVLAKAKLIKETVRA